jgi:DNA-binding transcriptional MerR regulator
MTDDESRFPWEDDLPADTGAAPGAAPGGPPGATRRPTPGETPAATPGATPGAMPGETPPAAAVTPGAQPAPVPGWPAGGAAQADSGGAAQADAGSAAQADAGSAAQADAGGAAAGPESAARERRAEPPQRPLVRKEYYSISEVSDIVGLPAHVLRYWESQFAVLNPSKNRSGNRVYQRKEIKLILLVKQLLHDEKYTVEGAKQKLELLRRGGEVAEASARALDEQLVRALREELVAIGELLRPDTA